MQVQVERIVPVLRVNNRKVNQEFLEQTLGLKTIMEEAAFAEFAGREQKEAQLVLMESPSVRTRAVKGLKKNKQIRLFVANPIEIETLLASGLAYEQLYKGQNGYAFTITSPEGDHYLLHSESDASQLTECSETSFQLSETVDGIGQFHVEEIAIHTPQPEVSDAFYQKLLGDVSFLKFYPAEGPDLLTAAEETWDLESIRIVVAPSVSLADLVPQLETEYFMDKKERFIQATDPSRIDVWIEK